MSDTVTAKKEESPAATESGKPPTTPESVSEKDKTTEEVANGIEDGSGDQDDVPPPHVHAKTFLAVFAVCLIYFAQDFALVGAGAVSYPFPYQIFVLCS